MLVELLSHRLLRRSGGGVPPTRRSRLGLTKEPGAATEQFAGRWIAFLDERVVADDESPAGLMRKIWESQFPLDEVRVQFVDPPSSGPVSKVS